MNARQKAKHFKRLYEVLGATKINPTIIAEPELKHYKAEFILSYYDHGMFRSPSNLEELVTGKLLSELEPVIKDSIVGEEDPYIRLANETVYDRYLALMGALGLPADEGGQNARYYTLIDVQGLCADRYGEAFAGWLAETRTEIDFLNDLAGKKGVVLMYGPGFSAPEGTVRISLANLQSEDYVEIARRLFELLDEYYMEFEEEAALADAA